MLNFTFICLYYNFLLKFAFDNEQYYYSKVSLINITNFQIHSLLKCFLLQNKTEFGESPKICNPVSTIIVALCSLRIKMNKEYFDFDLILVANFMSGFYKKPIVFTFSYFHKYSDYTIYYIISLTCLKTTGASELPFVKLRQTNYLINILFKCTFLYTRSVQKTSDLIHY